MGTGIVQRVDCPVYRVFSVRRSISVLFTVFETGKPVLCAGGVWLLSDSGNLEINFIFYRESRPLL